MGPDFLLQISSTKFDRVAMLGSYRPTHEDHTSANVTTTWQADRSSIMLSCLTSATGRRVVPLTHTWAAGIVARQRFALSAQAEASFISGAECRWLSSNAREAGNCMSCKDYLDTPAIIGRELLFFGSAQDVMHMRKSRGQLVDAALSQPLTAFLGLPQIQNTNLHEEKTEQKPSDKALEALESSINEDSKGLVFSLELSTKRTYQPSTIIRKRRHGFLSRLKSVGGRRILTRRRVKGRKKLTG